ncbi:MAG: preprotein translocase subunit SecY [Candidatus Nezhaarchaeota archaeon]|nr:preprotein translocase subunit SecY [Candidatus Nezhaarchaeota archaeon]
MVSIRGAIEAAAKAVPKVQRPIRKVGFTERILWTAVVLTIFLVMGQIPLYGIPRESPSFQQTIFNVIFAARRGTLLELGIGPIVTAGLIMQILAGTGLLRLDMTNPTDRATFTNAQRVLTVVVTAVEAAASALAYRLVGPQLTPVAVFVQLLVATLVLMLLDEMVSKGWGIGSGVSLFIAAGVAQQVFWYCFSPIPAREDGGPLGIFAAMVSYAMGGKDIGTIIVGSPTYPWLPTFVGFIAMVAMIVIVILFESMRVEIPIVHSRYGGFRAKTPLKFLYLSNIPVIFFGVIAANINMLAQLTGHPFIVGISLAFVAPHGLMQVVQNPLHALGYVLLVCATCALLALAWVEASGMSAKSQAEQIIKSGLQIPGFRSAPSIIEQYLARYIHTLTWVSGVIVALIASLGDVLGVLGGGTGILLMVGILYQYYQTLAKERAVEMYPMLKQFLGVE